MNKLKLYLLLLTGSLITIYPALTNGYPLIYFDSNTYLNLGFNLAPNKTNLMGYGIFIWLFSFKATLWTVILAQSFLINTLIYIVLRDFFKNNMLIISYLIVVSILSVFTGFSWFSSMLMADIFVPVMILSVYLFMKKQITKKAMYIYGFLILFAAETHITIVLTLFFLSIYFINRTIRNRKEIKFKKLQLYKSFFLLIPILFMLIFKSNDFFREDVNKKGVSHVYVMARLMEIGILDDYLEKNCENNHYKLCNYRDKFPDSPAEFVWNKKSPLYKTDGWKDTDGEYREIISEILSNPKYLEMLTYKSIVMSVRQFFSYNVELISLNKQSTIYKTIDEKIKHELKKFRTSKQFKGKIDLNNFNFLQNILIILSLVIVLYVLFTRNKKYFEIASFLFISIIINAFISGTISNVVNRYQARVAWLLIFVALIIIIQKIIEWRKIFQIVTNNLKNNDF